MTDVNLGKVGSDYDDLTQGQIAELQGSALEAFETVNEAKNEMQSVEMEDQTSLCTKGIYHETADGDNIPKLLGIKEIRILNTKPGWTYTVASVGINQEQGATRIWDIAVFRKNSEEVVIEVYRFEFSTNPSNGYINQYKGTSTGGEIINIAVKWEDIEEGLYTAMWAPQYRLKDSVFQEKGIPGFIATKKFEDDIDYLVGLNRSVYRDNGDDSSGRKRLINLSVKELYLEGGIPEIPTVFSVFQSNISGKWIIRLYQQSPLTLVSSLELLEKPSGGFRLYPLNGIRKGFILLDWGMFPENTDFNSMTDNEYIISDNCYILDANPSVKAHLLPRDINLYNLLKLSRNAISDPRFRNTESWLNDLENAILRGEETFGIKEGNVQDDANVAFSYRTSPGYVSHVFLKLNKEAFRQYRTGDWAKYGCYVRAKKPTTGNLPGSLMFIIADRYVEEGHVDNINQKTVALPFTEDWIWVEYTTQMQTVAYPKHLEVRYEIEGVTDVSIENTLGVEMRQPMIVFYKDGTQITDDTGFQDSASDLLKSGEMSDAIFNSIFSHIYKIGNYNNEFQFDKVQTGEITSYLLELLPNFNIPQVGACLSTDVDNAVFRNDPPALLDILKGWSPYLYINGVKRGCIVLYDENDAPFIFDKNGNKRLLNLI